MRTEFLKKQLKNTNQNKLNNLYEEFQHRHDFNSEDLIVLKNNFPNVKIGDIPEAWIILIDNMLQKISQSVRSVDQKFGLLIVNYLDNSDKSLHDVKRVVKSFENKLYAIDRDLHQEL